MAVVGEPLVTQVKRSAPFAVVRKSKRRINEFTSYSSLRTAVTGFDKDLCRDMGHLSGYERKNLPDIACVNLLNNVHYRSGRIDTTRELRVNLCGKLRDEECVRLLKKEAPTSTETCLSLQRRHFLDAIDCETCHDRNHSSSEGEVCSSRTSKQVKEWSSTGFSPDGPETSECYAAINHGRVISRRYINGLPVLFVPSVHSAMKFRFVKPSDSCVTPEVSVVQPLQKAFDQLFDVLHESLPTNELDASAYITVVNRWTNVRTELTRHLTKSLMRKMRRSVSLRSSFACYGVLMRDLQAFPLTDGIPFSSGDLEKTIDELSGFLKSGFYTKRSVVNMVLRLIFMVGCLENELLNCRLWSKRRVGLSCVCSWLSAENKFTFVKRIIQVFVDFLKCRESFISDLVTVTEAQDGDSQYFMVSELSSLLQRLVVMPQAVSTYPAQTADRIATELAAEYSQITLLAHRYELLESFPVPLIKLKLCQRVFERQHPSVLRARVCVSLTALTLDYLLKTYMRKAQKSGSKSEPDSDCVPCCVDGRILPLDRDACEEFSVLLFTIVLSYVQVKKEDYVDGPLWDHTTKKNESSLSLGDIMTLKHLPGQVEKLQRHLEEAVGSETRLTRKTVISLQKLACLSDIC